MTTLTFHSIVALCTPLLLAGGCAFATLEDEGDLGDGSAAAQSKQPDEDGFAEIAAGVWLKSDDDRTEWMLFGLEGHEWYQGELLRRIEDDPDSGRAAHYWTMHQSIEDAKDELVPIAEMEMFKGKTTIVDIRPVTDGYRAYAYAAKTGITPATVAVLAEVELEGASGIDSAGNAAHSDYGFDLSFSATVQRSVANPVDCHAYAWARSGSQSVSVDVSSCPGGSGGGGGGGGGCLVYPAPCPPE